MSLLDHTFVSALPTPLAVALQTLLDEQEARCADELAEFVALFVEYVGALAVADYLGDADSGQPSMDPELTGWIVSQLASAGPSTGVWARWTSMVAKRASQTSLPELREYVARQPLDDAGSDLAWLLAFRNQVMHGGFVAPLARIRAARRRLEGLFGALAPLLALEVRSRGPSGWHTHRGLAPALVEGPAKVSTEGEVFLVDGTGAGRLRLDPALFVDADGTLHLQHDWETHHGALFDRPSIHAWFLRYQRERRGLVSADVWSAKARAALPACGLVRGATPLDLLREAIRTPGTVTVVGPVGSGRTTLLAALADEGAQAMAVYPVEPHSVRQDPQVLRRWTLHALSTLLVGAPPPDDVFDGRNADGCARWLAHLASARDACATPVLAVDDAHLVGAGVYAETSREDCLAHARALRAAVVLVHTPGATPFERGDRTVEVRPWTADRAADWGLSAAELEALGGHAESLADPVRGPQALAARIAADAASVVHGPALLTALGASEQTVLELAERTGIFTPRVELSLRGLLDHLDVHEGAVRRYALRSGVRAALLGGAS
jgi:hypothetical protein